MTNSLQAKEASWIADFQIIPNAQERLAAVVERVAKRTDLPDSERIESNRIPGCVSRVWAVAELWDGKCRFRAEAESPLVKGLILLVCDLYSGATPAEAAAWETRILEEMGLTANLSPTRLNGLAALVAWIRSFASGQCASAAA